MEAFKQGWDKMQHEKNIRVKGIFYGKATNLIRRNRNVLKNLKTIDVRKGKIIKTYEYVTMKWNLAYKAKHHPF